MSGGGGDGGGGGAASSGEGGRVDVRALGVGELGLEKAEGPGETGRYESM